MAYEEAVRTVTLEAGTAITKNRFVTFASDGQADHAGTAQGAVHGVSQEDQATVGRDFAVALPGCKCKIEASAAISRGAVIATTNVGKAVTRGSSNGDQGWGVALEAAGADGDIITMLFMFLGQVNA